MIEVDWHPDRSKLRQFGWIAMAGFGLAGLILAWQTGAFTEGDSRTLPVSLWGLALFSGLSALIAPRLLRPLYLLLTAVALPIGLVVSNAALVLIFGLLFVPLAMWFRLRGRDELQRKWPATNNSFWLKCTPAPDVGNYYRPF